MRGTLRKCCLAAIFCGSAVLPARAQQEFHHPGETYDSLQAGQDAHADAEAQRRALIGRQIMIEDRIVQQNTWADPQDKYRPVRPESYGPILPKSYVGPTLADVYSYPPADGGPVFYGGTPAAAPTFGGTPARAPLFEPWPQVPGDIWAAPYYGYARQPIGHVKIWTGRLSYIYKPIYASMPFENPRPSAWAAAPLSRRPLTAPMPGTVRPSPAESLNTPPPPPKPQVPPPAGIDGKPGPPDLNPPRAGQEI